MSSVKMQGYKVRSMNFKVNEELPTTPGTHNFQITPKIRLDLRQKDKQLVIICTVTIDKHQATPTPFELETVVIGSFEITELTDIERMRIEASNMLYPYVRAAVTQLTAAVNMPAYFLPIIDFANVKPDAASSDGKNSSDGKGNNIIIRPLEDLE